MFASYLGVVHIHSNLRGHETYLCSWGCKCSCPSEWTGNQTGRTIRRPSAELCLETLLPGTHAVYCCRCNLMIQRGPGGDRVMSMLVKDPIQWGVETQALRTTIQPGFLSSQGWVAALEAWVSTPCLLSSAAERTCINDKGRMCLRSVMITFKVCHQHKYYQNQSSQAFIHISSSVFLW